MFFSRNPTKLYKDPSKTKVKMLFNIGSYRKSTVIKQNSTPYTYVKGIASFLVNLSWEPQNDGYQD